MKFSIAFFFYLIYTEFVTYVNTLLGGVYMSRKNRRRKGKKPDEKVLKSALDENVSNLSAKQIKELINSIKNFCPDCQTLNVDLNKGLITLKKKTDNVFHIIDSEGKEIHQYVYIKKQIHFDE